MRILLATDAWTPQINGVVMTLRNTTRGAEAAGHDVEVIGPDRLTRINQHPKHASTGLA